MQQYQAKYFLLCFFYYVCLTDQFLQVAKLKKQPKVGQLIKNSKK